MYKYATMFPGSVASATMSDARYTSWIPMSSKIVEIQVLMPYDPKDRRNQTVPTIAWRNRRIVICENEKGREKGREKGQCERMDG